MATIEEALQEALTPPDHYYGAITDLVKQGWAQVAGRHRDSDLLSISNWETMLEHYNEKYEVNDDFRVEGSSHWLVGWADCLLVRALQCNCEDWEEAYITHGSYKEFITGWWCSTCESFAEVRPVFQDALDFVEQLQDYPVLDEEDFSRREHEELMEYLESEVGKEDAPDLFDFLFDVHSVTHVGDVSDAMIEQFKEQRKLSWKVTVYAEGMKEITSWEIKDATEAEASNRAWKDVTSDYPNYYDWQLEEDSE